MSKDSLCVILILRNKERVLMIKFTELTAKEQKEIRSILRGNGLRVKDVRLYKGGQNIAIEIVKTEKIIKVEIE